MKVLALTVLRDGEEEALKTYAATVGPLMEQAGGRLVGRYEVVERLAGANPPQFFMIVEYPDRAAIARVFDSDEYRSLAPVIARAFVQYDVVLLG